MLKTAILVMMTSAVITVQPAEYRYTGYNGVEMLPGPNFILCFDNCPEPTPKSDRVVLRRHTRTPEQRITDTYARMDETIQKRQALTAGNSDRITEESGRGDRKSQEAFAKLDGYIKDMGKTGTPGNVRAATSRKRMSVSKPAQSDDKTMATYKDMGKQVNEVVEEDDEYSRTVYFELNSSVLSAKEKAKIDKWLPVVKINDFDVRGYTCQIGGETHNKKLSEERAQIVKAYILSKMKDAVIEAEGMGKGHYISPDNLPLNRRVEIKAFIANKPVPVTSEQKRPVSAKNSKPLHGADNRSKADKE